jgi:integrase
MPAELAEKLKQAKTFNQGYALTEILAAAELAITLIDPARQGVLSVLAIYHQLALLAPVARACRVEVKRRNKPYLTFRQFDELVVLIEEPYATMVYVVSYTGLRVSELAGLRWDDIHESSITIDERYCRGDWGTPKSECSNATIAVNRCVVERIHCLKFLTIRVKAGHAMRTYRAMKSDGPNDLVFQSVKDGKPMRDNNILARFIKPAARKLGLCWVSWRSLRTSHAVWLKMVGADVKDAHGQMRHSRASTTLDIYQQFVPESQQRVVDKLNSLSLSIN